MPSFHEFVELFPEAEPCAGTIVLDGKVLCEHHHGEYIVTEHGYAVYDARKTEGTGKGKGKGKDAKPAVKLAEPAASIDDLDLE